jgi:DNA-binding NtrC family response regulator
MSAVALNVEALVRSAASRRPGSPTLAGWAFAGVVGESRAIRSTLEYVRTLAKQETFNVLLVGDPGTGKALFARALHNAGPKSHLPFVTVNCSSAPASVIETELFGYEVGAFEGGTHRKIGLLELAGGGTVLLENIESLPVRLQPKLMHALAKRQARRVGGRNSFEVQATIIASTVRPLETLVAEGVFREDLFFELNAPRISLPKLIERDKDVLLLAQQFLEDAVREQGLRPMSLAIDAKNALLAYDWPGNVRELKTVTQRAAQMCDGPLVTSDHLRIGGAQRTERPSAAPSGVRTLRQIEADAITAALEIASGRAREAAATLDVSLDELMRKAEVYGLTAHITA